MGLDEAARRQPPGLRSATGHGQVFGNIPRRSCRRAFRRRADVAAQIDIADLACATTYQQSEQRWRHTAEIRARCGYPEFVDRGVQFRLGRWLCALCWTGTDRPSLLFDHACGWLIGLKVLLPGISILERFIAEIRSRMEARLWRLLVQDVDATRRLQLDALLTPAEGSRQSWFDQLRKGPVRFSSPALVQALLRVERVRGLGITLPSTAVPPSRIAALSRFANTGSEVQWNGKPS